MKDLYSSQNQEQRTYKSGFITEKQDEYSTANQLWNTGATEVQQLNPDLVQTMSFFLLKVKTYIF